MAPPYNFVGEIQIDHGDYIDRSGNKPQIIVNDVQWNWTTEQMGSFETRTIEPLYIEVFAGDKIQALRYLDWLIGKELRGSLGGLFLKKEIPLWRFAADGKSTVDEIGVIKFGSERLPITRFVPDLDPAELAYHYIIEFPSVRIVLDREV